MAHAMRLALSKPSVFSLLFCVGKKAIFGLFFCFWTETTSLPGACRCPAAQLASLILWLSRVTSPLSQYPGSPLSSPPPPTWPLTAAALWD